ncbi:MAG: hypothetical protein KKA07_12295 [Bacteroidetes bacterium]|nr:hypothetical protein [Bacteroidota bacterium]MBU1719838.1 hypothetical protein [Bacteroidota bacterium]
MRNWIFVLVLIVPFRMLAQQPDDAETLKSISEQYAVVTQGKTDIESMEAYFDEGVKKNRARWAELKKPPTDNYTGADKAQLKAKVKELFAKDCTTDTYVIVKVYITASQWDRASGERWDDASKSMKKYDDSSLEVDVICKKKSETNPTTGFWVKYNLFKNNISGNYSTDLLCTFIEDDTIELSKLK